MQQRIGDISPDAGDREIGLGDIITVLGRRRWLVVTVTGFLGALGAVGALLLPKSYQASVLLAPVSAPTGGALGALSSAAGQLGGLSSLVGLSLSPGMDSTREAVATLESTALARRYIETNDLLPILYGRRWDASQRKWHGGPPPTLWQASEFFINDIRRVSEDTRTGLVTLTVRWRDPMLAANWANALVDLANSELRGKAIEESQRAITYLRAQAESANAVEVKNAIYSLMKAEIEKEMMAKGREQYALKVVDPAIAPEEHSSPSLKLWVLAGLVGGFVVAAVLVLVLERKTFLRGAWPEP